MLRSFVILAAILTLHPIKCTSSKKPQWWTNFTTLYNEQQQLTILSAAREHLLNDAEMITAARGRLIETFRSQPGRCALACAATSDCHFVKLTKRPSDNFFDCALYSEFGTSLSIDVVSNGAYAHNVAADTAKWMEGETSENLLQTVLTEY